MRSQIDTFLSQKIKEATVCVLKTLSADNKDPIEYYSDDILRYTLENCCKDFLNLKKPRASEKNLLEELHHDLNENQCLTITEAHLTKNLALIRPVWGELFGTNRGLVYNTFMRLKAWKCFDPKARLFYQQHRRQQENPQFAILTQRSLQQRQQLDEADAVVQNQSRNIEELTRLVSTNMQTIQELRIEIDALKRSHNTKPHTN